MSVKDLMSGVYENVLEFEEYALANYPILRKKSNGNQG